MKTLLLGVAMFLAGASVDAQTAISANGVVESTVGGFRFPDGTVQTTAVGPARAPVGDTGQQSCWDAAGNPIGCAGTGQDGELQAGADWPAPRFTDNGNGTIDDNLTGLVWLKDANCFGIKSWANAFSAVGNLNSGSIACTGYTAGTFSDWRLPNIKELLSLFDYGTSNPPLPASHPFVGVTAQYWSSTTSAASPAAAWNVNLSGSGNDNITNKAQNWWVWPVRGGQ